MSKTKNRSGFLKYIITASVKCRIFFKCPFLTKWRHFEKNGENRKKIVFVDLKKSKPLMEIILRLTEDNLFIKISSKFQANRLKTHRVMPPSSWKNVISRKRRSKLQNLNSERWDTFMKSCYGLYSRCALLLGKPGIDINRVRELSSRDIVNV